MRTLIASIILLSLVPLAWAEPLPISYTEPDMVAAGMSGQLHSTCVRICWCTQCTATPTCEKEMAKVCTLSDDGNGADTINVEPSIPVYEGDLPVTVRYCTSAINTDGNESDRWTDCGARTWSAP